MTTVTAHEGAALGGVLVGPLREEHSSTRQLQKAPPGLEPAGRPHSSTRRVKATPGVVTGGKPPKRRAETGFGAARGSSEACRWQEATPVARERQGPGRRSEWEPASVAKMTAAIAEKGGPRRFLKMRAAADRDHKNRANAGT